MLVLVVYLMYDHRFQLVIARLPKAGEEGAIVWKLLSKESVPVPEEISSATVKYMDLVHEGVSEPVSK